MVSASNFTYDEKDLFTQPATGFLPRKAVVPISQDDTDIELLIKENDYVSEGEIIAKGKNICVHATIPGKVSKISSELFSNGKQGICAEISLEGKFNFVGKKVNSVDWKNYEPSSLSILLNDKGVLNTFKDPVPIYKQIREIQNKENKIIAVRLFDDDPSRNTETFISTIHTREIIEGAYILSKAIQCKTVIFAYSKSSSFDLSPITEIFSESENVYNVPIDAKKYPAGTMHNLVSAVKKTYKNIDSLKNLGRKDFFVDSLTCFNIYNAIVYGKPVMSNFVHVTGECLNSSAIFNVKIGTTLEDLVEQCGGFKKQAAKIVINGTMTGKAVSSLKIPITKSVKSVEFIPARKINSYHTEDCIRCGNCRKICPVGLWPGNLKRIFTNELDKNDFEKEIAQTAILCTECGLCNSVCPSRIPISQTIALMKEKFYDNK